MNVNNNHTKSGGAQVVGFPNTPNTEEERARRLGAEANLHGAAHYLGICDETLRQRHLRGEGPKRIRNGRRGWSYAYADLDAYATALTE
jgi:hypothetical protein